MSLFDDLMSRNSESADGGADYNDASNALGSGTFGIPDVWALVKRTTSIDPEEVMAPRAAYTSRSERDAKDNLAAREDDDNRSVLDRISDGFGRAVDGIGKAYDKDPLKFLEFGLGTVGGMYKAAEGRKAADAQAQGYLDRQNNEARLQMEDKQRYTASQGTAPQTSLAQQFLKRKNGQRIFDNNGKIVG